MMRLRGEALLRLLSRFSGLHLHAHSLESAKRDGRCQAAHASAKPMSFSSASADSSSRVRMKGDQSRWRTCCDLAIDQISSMRRLPSREEGGALSFARSTKRWNSSRSRSSPYMVR